MQYQFETTMGCSDVCDVILHGAAPSGKPSVGEAVKKAGGRGPKPQNDSAARWLERTPMMWATQHLVPLLQ